MRISDKAAQVGLFAMAVSLGACSSGGGSDSNITTIVGDITVDGFPGNKVQDNNVADDQRGFSPNDVDFTAMRRFPNGTTGTGLVIYSTSDSRAFASFYNGAHFTSPQELRQAANEDLSPATALDLDGVGTDVFVLWLNTSQHPNANARGRDGDALILWSQNDLGATGSVAGDGIDGPNLALFLTYFDRSSVGNGALRHGFQEFAQRVDNAISGQPAAAGGGTFQDDEGENVVTFNFLSDGCQGRNHGSGGETRNVTGDLVTFDPVIVWTQNDLGVDNDATPLDDDTPVNDDRLFGRVVNLTGADLTTVALRNQIEPGLLTRAATNFGDQGGNANLNRRDSVILAAALSTYNNAMLFQQRDQDFATSSNTAPATTLDTALVINFINTSPADANNPFTGPIEVTPIHDPTDTIVERHENQFHANGIMGPDEGLVNQLLIFTTHARTAEDRGFFVAQYNPNNRSDPNDDNIVELSIDDADITDPVNNVTFPSATATAADAGRIKHVDRLSRDRSYVMSAWLQLNDLATDTIQLEASAVRTNAAGGLEPLADNVTLPIRVSTNDGADVTAFQFQEELSGDPVQADAGGSGTGTSDEVTNCPIQSDLSSMFIMFEQSELNSAATPTEDRVFVRRLTFTIVGTVLSVAPSATVVQVPGGSVTDGFDNNEMEGSSAIASRNLDRAGATAGDILLFDNSDRVAGAGGAQAVVIYVRNTTSGPEAIAFEINSPGTGGDIASGGEQDIDSGFLTTNIGVRSGSLSARTTPTALGTGAFAGSRLYVVFREDRFDSVSSNSIALRAISLDKGAKAGNVTFAAQFSPNATGTPFTIDNGFDRTATLNTVAHSGDRLGVFFSQEGHVYFNEATNGVFTTINGLISPQLVDNDRQDSANSTFVELSTFPDANCNSLSGSVVFFSTPDFEFDQRLHARRLN